MGSRVSHIKTSIVGSSEDTCLYMGSRVSLTMFIFPLLRHNPGKLIKDVVLDMRVCILIYGHTRAGVRDIYITYSSAQTAVLDRPPYITSYVYHLCLLARLYIQLLHLYPSEIMEISPITRKR